MLFFSLELHSRLSTYFLQSTHWTVASGRCVDYWFTLAHWSHRVIHHRRIEGATRSFFWVENSDSHQVLDNEVLLNHLTGYFVHCIGGAGWAHAMLRLQFIKRVQVRHFEVGWGQRRSWKNFKKMTVLNNF